MFWREEDTEMAMLSTILGALLPMVVTFLLGFVAAWRHDFGSKDASTLNRMVLLYAVPLALFAGTVTTSRAALSQDIPLVIALCVGIIGFYGVVFLFSRLVSSHASEHQRAGRADGFRASSAFRRSSRPRRSVRRAQRHSDRDSQSRHQPHGRANHDSASRIGFDRERPTEQTLPSAGRKESIRHRPPNRTPRCFAAKLAETVKEPIVWAPVLAFIIVLSGFRIPQLIVHSLSLLGHASGGVALFACGIVLASGKIKVNRYVLFFVFLKNIMQPALVLGGLRWIGYGNPVVSEAVLTTAIPAMPIVIMFALQYRIAQAEAASAVFLSVMGSIVTMGVFIALTH